jgi:hypothetical protein
MCQRMRTLPYFAVVCAFSLVPCFAQKPSATLEIQTPESRFIAGTIIRLDVVVKNSMTKVLHVWKASPEGDGQAEACIAVEVSDSEGRSLPRTDRTTIVRNGKKYTFPKSWLTLREHANFKSTSGWFRPWRPRSIVGNVYHRVSVVTFDSSPKLIEPFTPDLDEAEATLRDLSVGCSRQNHHPNCSGPKPVHDRPMGDARAGHPG